MTAISVHRTVTPALVTRATPFDRALLRAASALDSFVAARLARRVDAVKRRALTVQASAVQTRRDAEARGVIGILP